MFKRTNFVLTKCIGEILCTGIIDIICIETEFDECLLTKIDLCNKTEYRIVLLYLFVKSRRDVELQLSQFDYSKDRVLSKTTNINSSIETNDQNKTTL